MPKSKESPFRLSLIGAETMLGKDIAETLGTRRNLTITTYSATGEGSFGEQEGEAIYVAPFSLESAAEERMIVLAGADTGAQKAYPIARDSRQKPVVVDAHGALESMPEGILTSTILGEVKVKPGSLLILAHPVAGALTLLLSRLAKYQAPVRVVVNVLEPASERGGQGIGELHKQTAALLAFKPLPKEIFDAQLAFNTLARLGEEAKLRLDDIERKIHLQSIKLAAQVNLQSAITQMSLRLIQAPVFHGYSISLFVEFAAKADREAVAQALACAQIEVRSLGEETPNAVEAASTSGIMAGDIRIDTANPKAVWIWMVFDNLRFLADSVAALVAEMQPERL